MNETQKLAHDLRQPLTILRSFFRQLEEKRDDPVFLEDVRTYIPEALNRIEDIATQLEQIPSQGKHERPGW
ncbi:MAG: hypothetical protein R3A11_05115 [Bdellovibrionota bacterium]